MTVWLVEAVEMLPSAGVVRFSLSPCSKGPTAPWIQLGRAQSSSPGEFLYESEAHLLA